MAATVQDTSVNDLCKALNVKDDIRSAAHIIKEEMVKSGSEEVVNSKHNWDVCSLYIALTEWRTPEGSDMVQPSPVGSEPMSVSDLLREASVKICDFFRSMKIIKENWTLSGGVIQHLIQVERKYLITSPLFAKFKKMFSEIFASETTSTNNNLMDIADTGYEERMKFCWILFIYLKSLSHEQQGGQRELAFSFYMLLCCIEYVILLTPSFRLRPPFDSSRFLVGHNDVEGEVLKTLCSSYKTNYFEVKMVQATFVSLIQDLPQAGQAIDVEEVVKSYLLKYRTACDINELDFLNGENYLSISTVQVTERDDSRPSMATTSTLSVSMPQQQSVLTPVRSAMNSIHQLANLLHQCSDQPSDCLAKFIKATLNKNALRLRRKAGVVRVSMSSVGRQFQALGAATENALSPSLICKVDPSPIIAEQLSQLKEVFINKFTIVMGQRQSPVAELRFNLATRLYYRVMESLLLFEEQRLGQQDFSHLLNQKVFHKCLLACSVEVVLATYEAQTTSNIISPSADVGQVGTSFLFPWILTAFDLGAFDFFKVLESFVRAEPKLAPEIIRIFVWDANSEFLLQGTCTAHLRLVENRILEQLAWHHDSPLLEMLRNYDCPQKQLFDSSGCPSDAVEVSTGNATSMSSVISTKPDVDAHLVAVMQSPRSSPRQSFPLNLFLNKVLRLGYERLQTLCSALDVSADLLQKIWICLEYCITNRPSLLCDRHLDQVLMCCMYAICKVVDREIRFKTIVNVYRQLPTSSQQVYKRVLISSGDYDSVIAFYNKVFMQSLKTYILQFNSSRMQSGMPSPVSRSVISPSRASPKYPHPGRQNFYISPMKDSEFKSPMSPTCMTPRTKHLYSFGDSLLSGEKLKAFNEKMRKQSPSFKSLTSKCLKFDNKDSSEASVVPTSTFTLTSPGRKVPSSRKSLFLEDVSPNPKRNEDRTE